MNKSTKFWNKIAQRYSKQAVTDVEAYQKKLTITQQYLKPDMEILEFGCGTGSTAIAHASFVKKIKAIDISTKMIEIAQTKAEKQDIKNVSFEVGDIDDLSVHEQRFDSVMAHSILHLLENKPEVLIKVYNMIKSGGFFVSSTMCLGNSIRLRAMQPFLSIAAYFGLLPKINLFTANELQASLTTAGFKIEYQWQPKENSAVFIIAQKP